MEKVIKKEYIVFVEYYDVKDSKAFNILERRVRLRLGNIAQQSKYGHYRTWDTWDPSDAGYVKNG